VKLRPWLGSWSTYTVLGLIGYIVASVTIGILGNVIGLDDVGRLIAIVMPALGFLAAVFINRLVLGEERIVFYQASFGAWLAACVAAWCAGARVAVVSDLVILLVAIFLAFGRVGCLHVACCHGRPSRIGVHYHADHVALGFPKRWLGRRIFPVQLVESVVSAGLAVACTLVILSNHAAGTATCVFVLGYALARFPLELARGDAARPYFKGLSEAQWIALVTTLAALGYGPTAAALVATTVLLAMLAGVAAYNRVGSGLARPNHLDEIEHSLHQLVRRGDSQPVWTSWGLKLSANSLPDGTIDVVCSHAELTTERIEHVAVALFAQHRVVAGQTAGLFHVLVDRDQLRS